MARTIYAKDVSKLIRKRLKTTFPTITFSVRTRHGNSVDISWIDGPTIAMVDTITNQYKGGGFDGMIDMAYSIDHWLLPDGSTIIAKSSGTENSRGSIPAISNPEKPHPNAEFVHFGSTFVSTSRDYTTDFKRRALNKVRKYWYFQPDIQKQIDSIDYVETAYGSNLSSDVYLSEHNTYLSDLVNRELRKRATVMPVPKA